MSYEAFHLCKGKKTEWAGPLMRGSPLVYRHGHHASSSYQLSALPRAERIKTLVSGDFLVSGRTHALAHSLSLNLDHGLDWQNVDNMKFTIACVPMCVREHVFMHVCLCMPRCVSVHGCICVRVCPWRFRPGLWTWTLQPQLFARFSFEKSSSVLQAGLEMALSSWSYI